MHCSKKSSIWKSKNASQEWKFSIKLDYSVKYCWRSSFVSSDIQHGGAALQLQFQMAMQFFECWLILLILIGQFYSCQWTFIFLWTLTAPWILNIFTLPVRPSIFPSGVDLISISFHIIRCRIFIIYFPSLSWSIYKINLKIRSNFCNLTVKEYKR